MKPLQIKEIESAYEISLKQVKESNQWYYKNTYQLDSDNNIIKLDLSYNHNIDDLSPLAKLTHLIELDLCMNDVMDITPLKNLKNLRVIDLSKNSIIDISPLEKLKHLESIDLSSNNSIINFHYLEKNKSLKKLTLSGFEFLNIENLGNLTQLEYLNLNSSTIYDFKFLKKLKFLKSLHLRNSNFKSLNYIKHLTDLYYLDISHNNLPTLKQLQNLKSLKVLLIGNNPINDISPLAELVNLRFLNIVNINEIDLSVLTNLTDLVSLAISNNKINNWDCIEKFKLLEHLEINSCELSKIEKLAGLKNLLSIDAFNNDISNLNPLSNLKKLTSINFNKNNIICLEPLSNLKNLREVHLFENQIINIDSLANLKKIRVLDLDSNNISTIKPLYHLIKKGIAIRHDNNEDFDEDDRLDISNNPINIPPFEFIEMGNETIVEYFDDTENYGNKRVNECKLIFVGEGSVGKTSLMKRLVFNTFNINESTTHGINKIAWKEICNEHSEEIRINLWDFGGQHLQHSLHQFFLTKRVIYVLVLNPRNDEKADYWLKQIENLGGDSEVLIVYNWRDEKDKQPTYLANYYELKKTYPYISEPILLSCKTNDGVDEFKKTIKNTIISQTALKDEYPLNWFKIKNSLEELVTLERNYISYTDYETICDDNNYIDSEKKRNLLMRLNNIGSIVFFEDPNLIQLQVLNPDWITTFAYSIITSEITRIRNGHLNLTDLKEIFKDSKEVFSNKVTSIKYRDDQFDFILKLMIKYDLCQINPFNHNEYLFPTSFKGSPENDYTSIKRSGRHYRFLFDSEFEMLIIHRFIARNVKKAITGDFWQSGIYINNEDKDTSSLIETNRHSKVINCWISGKNIRGLWEVIRSDIKDICRIYDNLYFQEQILYNSPEHEVFLSYDEMVNSLRNGIRVIEWHPTYSIRNIDVINVLEDFEDTTKIMSDINKFGAFINNGTISNSQIGGVKNTQTNYVNNYSQNPIIDNLKDILDDLQDAAKVNFEWQENFTNALKAIYNLEEAKDVADEKIQISKLKKFFNKAKEIKDWATITLLPAEIATKGSKMGELGRDLITHLTNLLN